MANFLRNLKVSETHHFYTVTFKHLTTTVICFHSSDYIRNERAGIFIKSRHNTWYEYLAYESLDGA